MPRPSGRPSRKEWEKARNVTGYRVNWDDYSFPKVEPVTSGGLLLESAKAQVINRARSELKHWRSVIDAVRKYFPGRNEMYD